MQSSPLLTASPKWLTTFLPRARLLQSIWQTCLSHTSGNSTALPNEPYRIEALFSTPSSLNKCINVSILNPPSPGHTVPRQTDNQNAPIRFLRGIFVITYHTDRTTGLHFYHWPNSHTTTVFKPLRTNHLSLRVMVFIPR